jgi:hypothetical protein
VSLLLLPVLLPPPALVPLVLAEVDAAELLLLLSLDALLPLLLLPLPLMRTTVSTLPCTGKQRLL